MKKLAVTQKKSKGAPLHIGPNGESYGNDKYDWSFELHWPVLSLDYYTLLTGENLAQNLDGNQTKAQAELFKIARLQKTYIKSLLGNQHVIKYIEYEVAHDSDLINQLLLGQIEILGTEGGYTSYFTVGDNNQPSLGKQAEEFHKNLGIYQNYRHYIVDDWYEGY